MLSGESSIAHSEPGGKRAAWSIQKRFLKSAVLRNAVKRQLRECVRKRKIAADVMLVFLGRKAFLDQPGAKRDLRRSIRVEAEGLLDRIQRRA